jgi:2-methylcitrate dehydratase PrpD
VFGTIAAAAAAARAMSSTPLEMANAVAIALDRSAGLASNSAATRIGLTHFGWAAAHGLEAAWLARTGLSASLDLTAALGTYFPDSAVDTAPFEGADVGQSLRRTYFKQYPCNVYLNLIVKAADGVVTEGIDRIELELPPVRHLDAPSPTDVRAARNSAQAVAAAASSSEPTYATFSSPQFDLNRNAALSQLASKVTIKMDPRAPTGLDEATVRFVGWSGSRLVVDRTVDGSSLGPWTQAHRRQLTRGLDLDSWLDRVITADYASGHESVLERLLAPASAA